MSYCFETVGFPCGLTDPHMKKSYLIIHFKQVKVTTRLPSSEVFVEGQFSMKC